MFQLYTVHTGLLPLRPSDLNRSQHCMQHSWIPTAILIDMNIFQAHIVCRCPPCWQRRFWSRTPLHMACRTKCQTRRRESSTWHLCTGCTRFRKMHLLPENRSLPCTTHTHVQRLHLHLLKMFHARKVCKWCLMLRICLVNTFPLHISDTLWMILLWTPMNICLHHIQCTYLCLRYPRLTNISTLNN